MVCVRSSVSRLRGCSWVLVALAACGDHSSSADANVGSDTDGAPVDVVSDGVADSLACTSNGTTGPVTIDGPSLDLGSSIAVTVLGHDTSGAVVHRSPVLAADATYTFDVTSCAMVTVYAIEQPNQNTRIVTWTGVQQGDLLVAPRRSPATAEHTVEVTVSPASGATQYDLSVACPGGRGSYGNVSTGLTTHMIQCPVGTTTISVLARADGPSSTSFAAFDNVTLAATGSTVVTVNSWQPANGTVTVSVNGLGSFASGSGGVAAIRTDATDRAPHYDTYVQTLPSGNFGFAPLPVMSGPGDVSVMLNAPSSATPDRELVHRTSFAAFPTTYALSIGVDTLPLLSASIGANALRPTIVWASDGPLQADGFIAEVRYRSLTHWLLIAPAVPGSVMFPELPVDLLPIEPTVERFTVLAANPVSVTGYDSIRQRVASLLTDRDGEPAPMTSATYRQ